MIIRTYKELKEYMQMFKNKNSDLLVIMSRGGLGKTSLLKEVMRGSEFVYVNTHSTPLKTYIDLFEHRDSSVVFDDLDAVLSNPIFTSMLKALADTSPIKELHYNTTSKLLGNVPEQFKTASNVCILLNQFDVRNKTLAPLIDRGFFIEFMPSKEEILSKIKEISKSQNIVDKQKCKEVLDFFLENYRKVEEFSIRTYIKALQLCCDDYKNWKSKFMQVIGIDEKIIAYLLLKDKYKNVEDMVKNYKWSRATFFRVKAEVEGE